MLPRKSYFWNKGIVFYANFFLSKMDILIFKLFKNLIKVRTDVRSCWRRISRCWCKNNRTRSKSCLLRYGNNYHCMPERKNSIPISLTLDEMMFLNGISDNLTRFSSYYQFFRWSRIKWKIYIPSSYWWRLHILFGK